MLNIISMLLSVVNHNFSHYDSKCLELKMQAQSSKLKAREEESLGFLL